MERYDSYKDSGIEWLGEIPSHWKVQRAKTIFNRHKRAVRPTDEVVTCFRDGQVTLRSNRRTEGFTNALKEFGYQGVRKGDLVVHQMDAFAGSIGVSDSDGKSTPVYSVCTTRNPQHSEMYYAYLLRTMAQKKYIESLSRGIRERSTAFGYDVMGELWLPIPTPDEQMTIVDYINKETAKIDEAIAQQQRMIDLLNERKQIIIDHAVTRGLNPDISLKPSGIDWVEKIPTNWQIQPIKFIFNQRNEVNIPVRSKERLSLSIDKGVTLYSEKTTNLDRFKEDFTQYKLAHSGDIVLNSMNMIVGAVGLSPYYGCVSPAYYIIYPSSENIDANFYSYLLNCRSIRGLYRGLGRGIMSIDRGDGRVNTCRLKVSYTDFGRIEVPVPPISEQKVIAQFINSSMDKIEESIISRQKLISLLQERKQIIINEVVTGKVKVL